MPEVIDIYEKYANLFKLKIKPTIDFLYKIPPAECNKYPVISRTGDGTGYSLVGKEGFEKVQPDHKTVTSILKRVFCNKIRIHPELLRIPTQIGHPFRSKPATYSVPIRPVIPKQTGHPLTKVSDAG